MKSFLTSDERNILESLKLTADQTVHRAASLLLMADEGMPVRQVAAQVGLSSSGVFYWVSRFRHGRMALFNLQPGDQVQSNSILADEVLPSKAQVQAQDLIESTDDSQVEISLSSTIQSPGVLPDDHFAEAGRKIMRYHFSQMLSHEAGTIQGEDIEALHDMRVATRRLRAAFGLFAEAYKPKKFKALLKGLRLTGRALGRVRDLDVFIDKVNAYIQSLMPEQQHGMDSLLQAWQNQRNEHRAAMLAYLESPAYLEFKQVYSTFLQTPGADVRDPQDKEKSANVATLGTRADKIYQIVPLLIYSRLAAVTTFDDILPTATIPQLHALRIEFKRLRYALEFFAEILGPEVKMIINEIKQLQDHLGDLHDADVACHNLSEIITGWENQHSKVPLVDRPDPGAVIAYLAYSSRERHNLLSSFPEAWVNFNRPEIRHNLALAIAAL